MSGGREKVTSRLAMQKGSPEELLKRFDDNIADWAAEIIKEVDTTGTGTITYDEWVGRRALRGCNPRQKDSSLYLHSTTFRSFMGLTLLTLLISTIPSTVWMTEIRRCGPFQGIRPVEAPGIFVRNLAMNMTCVAPIDADLDEGLECQGLSRAPCMALQSLGQVRPQAFEAQQLLLY